MSAELDIAGNIRVIEQIKSDLLKGVSELFISMLANDADLHNGLADKRLNNLSDIVIITYCLAEKLGVSCRELDLKIIGRLKLDSLKGSPSISPAILKHFSNN